MRTTAASQIDSGFDTLTYDKGICVWACHTRIAYSVVRWYFHHSPRTASASRAWARQASPLHSSASCHYVYWNLWKLDWMAWWTRRRSKLSVLAVLTLVSHWLHKRELAAFSIAFYMQTSLAELYFHLAGSYIYSYMCRSECVCVLCVSVFIHSLMYSFIYIICMLLSQQNLTYFASLICTYSCYLRLLSFTTSHSVSLSLPLFFAKLGSDFVHLISAYVCESGFHWIFFMCVMLKHFFFILCCSAFFLGCLRFENISAELRKVV